MEKNMALDRNIQHASCCMGEICTYFPNIIYWLNMISCKRGGFSRIYCLHKEELSHLVSTYQYFSAMPWHKRLVGFSAYCILPWWLALFGLGWAFALQRGNSGPGVQRGRLGLPGAGGRERAETPRRAYAERSGMKPPSTNKRNMVYGVSVYRI